MKKMMMAVAGLAMAVVVTGCGGSPKSAAEKFMDAVIQRETDKALKYVDTTTMTAKEIKNLKEALDNAGKDINDNKLESEAFYEWISVPREDSGYTLINGAKYTGEKATVRVQFKKEKDKKPEGRRLELLKVDGSWKVQVNVEQKPEKDKDGKFVKDDKGELKQIWVVSKDSIGLLTNLDTEAK